MIDSLQNNKRSAFTMIELVFSIVIVGLVILSIPLIVRQSNLNTAMSQNVIGYYNALTLMETIKSKPWDTNNVNDFVASGEYYILQTGNAGTDCFTIVNPNAQDPTHNHIVAKKGLSLANKRRMCDPNNKTASAVGGGNLDSINSFNGYSTKVASDGVDIFQLDVEVRYVNVDFANGVIQNARGAFDDVKEIRIILKRLLDGNAIDNDGEAVFTYYAANIGNDIPLVKDNSLSANP